MLFLGNIKPKNNGLHRFLLYFSVTSKVGKCGICFNFIEEPAYIPIFELENFETVFGYHKLFSRSELRYFLIHFSSEILLCRPLIKWRPSILSLDSDPSGIKRNRS